MIKRNAAVILLACLFAALLSASFFRLFESYELASLDARFVLRIPKIPTSDKIAIIEIGEDTLKKLGHFPFDRSYHAIAVKALSEFGAKAIIFDLLFSEPSGQDKEFEDAVKKAGNVYLSYAFSLRGNNRDNITEADGYIAGVTDGLGKASKVTGHINVLPDPDGKFRRVPPYIKYGWNYYPYISIKAGCDYLGVSDAGLNINPGRKITIGKNISIPVDDQSAMVVNFSGKWGNSYSHYSYVDLLRSYADHISSKPSVVNAKDIAGKICIIGLTAAGTGDIHPSPFEPMCPGVGIHAEILNSLINNKFISRASKKVNIIVLIILAAVTAFATVRTKPLNGFFVLLAAVAIFCAGSLAVFNIYGLWIDAACPVFAIFAVYISCTLYKYISEWKKRLVMERELEIAKKIQESFLPKALPDIAGIEISASMLTARQVGGDLYDIIDLGGGRIGIMAGDVSGKGIPASLFMAMVAGAFKFFALPGAKPEEVLSGLNAKLVKESSSGLFVTVFYAILDLKSMRLDYANGGHLPAILFRKSERAKFLDTDEGQPLGLFEGNYSSGAANIKNGDLIVFYTDGVTEAMARSGEMYGKERLASVIEKAGDAGSAEILNVIEKDVRKFEPAANQHDDITIITVRVK